MMQWPSPQRYGPEGIYPALLNLLVELLNLVIENLKVLFLVAQRNLVLVDGSTKVGYLCF